MRRACVVYGGAQERQEILLGGGVSCLFKLKIKRELIKVVY